MIMRRAIVIFVAMVVFITPLIAGISALQCGVERSQRVESRLETQSITDDTAFVEKVRDALITAPEMLQQAMNHLDKKQAATERSQRSIAIEAAQDALFHSPDDAIIGNPEGTQVLVEFFDYNCGFCRRAMTDMLSMIEQNPDVKIILKEFPVLGSGSVEAARVAVALHKQQGDYLAFHIKLMNSSEQITGELAKQTAREVGADMQRLEQDLSSGEMIDSVIRNNYAVAESLFINGTPAYVTQQEVFMGAVGLGALEQALQRAYEIR